MSAALVRYEAARVALAELTAAEWCRQARAQFIVSERRACAVCGKYQSLTHAHHVVPLSAQAAGDRSVINHAHEWLCPTHHAAVHVFLTAGKTAPAAISVAADIPVDELRVVMRIAERAHK